MSECLFGEEEYALTSERQRELQSAVAALCLELEDTAPQVVVTDPAQNVLFDI